MVHRPAQHLATGPLEKLMCEKFDVLLKENNELRRLLREAATTPTEIKAYNSAVDDAEHVAMLAHAHATASMIRGLRKAVPRG